MCEVYLNMGLCVWLKICIHYAGASPGCVCYSELFFFFFFKAMSWGKVQLATETLAKLRKLLFGEGTTCCFVFLL